MVDFHFIALRVLCISFITLCGHAQFQGPVEVQRAFPIDIDVPSSIFIFREFTITTLDANDVALYNISLNFENGECINPSIQLQIEVIDGLGDREIIYVFYPEFNDDSLIAECQSPFDESCDDFLQCTKFSPPAGVYTDLLFYIGTGDLIGAECGTEGDVDDPLRTFRGEFTVACEVDVESLCPECVQGGASDSSDSESGDNAIRELGHILEEEHDLRNENEVKHNDEEAKDEIVTLKFDDDTCDNLWIMLVASVCVCIASCGLNLCLLYNKK